MDNKAVIIAAPLEEIIPCKKPPATHQIRVSRNEIAQPQQVAIFVNDGYNRGLRFILTSDNLYRWIETIQQIHKVAEVGKDSNPVYEQKPSIFLVQEDTGNRLFISALVERLGVKKVYSNGQVITI